MSDSDKTREELLKEVSALREQLAKLQGIKSEKATAEEKGRQSAERFRELTAHIHQVLWMIEAKESTILYVSAGYEEIWGRSCQSLIDNPHSYMEGIHPLDQEMMRREDAAMYQTGHIDVESRVLRPDGLVRWVWIRGYPVREQGQIVRLVGVIEDITEKRRLAAEREALLSRLQLHIQRMPLAYVLFDADMRIVDCNPTAERIFGYTREEMLGAGPPYKKIVPHAFWETGEEIRSRIRSGDMQAHSINENLTKDGRTITCQWFNTPLLDDNGQFVGFLCLAEDMTERKATDAALHISQERNAAVLRASLDAIVIMDHEGKVVDFNPAAEATFGYSHAEAVGKDMSELIMPPQMRDRHRQGLAHYLATGESPILNRRLEMPACRADGTEFAAELTITRIEGEGNPLFTGFMRDITEQKALHDDQARLAAIVQFSENPIVSKTVDGIVISWNHGAELLYGYSAKEMIGKSISILFAPDHFQEYLQIMKKVKKGMSIPTYETVRRRKDGTEVNVSVGISTIKNSEGEIVEASVISHNITEKKASEEQMRLLLESTGEGIYGVDMQGRCTFINQAAAAMLGYAPADVIGQDTHALIHHHRPDGSLYPVEQCPIVRAMQSQSGVRVQNEVLWRKDRTFFAAEYSSFPIMKGKDIQGAVVTFQDVTQTKLLEEQFRQAQKMDAVGRLAGGVAHDFNNLLTIISGYSDILLNAVPPGHATRGMLTEIQKAGMRAASLTRQLLASSRKQMLEYKLLDLNAVVADSGKMFMRLVGEDIDLVTVLDPALGKVKTDLGQMEQVLMNLVVNARDAMPHGGKITIETANVVLDETYCRSHADVKPGRYILLALSDNGCGMDERTKARIFEPFFTTKEPGKGTGLGLAMIHGFIKQSGGHVSVYSEPGVGTTFKIYLPEVEAGQSSETVLEAIDKMPHGDETILLVEDEAGVRALTQHVLQTCGYKVLEAAHGGEAIRIAEKHAGSIDLLITDVVMPGIGGRLVAERVVALKPGTKVLYLSGYTDDAVVRHGVLQSEAAFLQKPFTPSLLAVKVRKVLGTVTT